MNQMAVQCLQLPASLELEVSWTIKLVQEDPASSNPMLKFTISDKFDILQAKADTTTSYKDLIFPDPFYIG